MRNKTGAQAKSPGEMLMAQPGMGDRLVLALSSAASSKATQRARDKPIGTRGKSQDLSPDGASSRKWFLVGVSLSMFYWVVRYACEDADTSSDVGPFETS